MRADVVLRLVSNRILASPYVRDVEINQALQRAQSGACRVVPIILEKADWTGDSFGNFNALPPKGKAIRTFRPRNDGWHEVAVGLRKLLEDLRSTIDRDEPGMPQR